MASSLDIALVGREAPDEENLGLRYVAGALVAAGHEVRVYSLNGLSAIPALAERILERRPHLIGLALSDPTACIEHLVLARYLRQGGYTGHIVAGGAFATLVRHELLQRHSAIDSIVRHAGEEPAVELAKRLAHGHTWHDSPGLTTRSGDGFACAPSQQPFPVRPLRPEQLHRVLGVPVARLLASRGCNGSCRYCGSSALRRMAIKEGRRAGWPMADLKQAGVGARRRRSPEDVADEIGDLYHRRGVRVLQVLDDNLVGDSGDESLAFALQLQEKLQQRGVGRMAMTLMIDPDTVTRPMIEALKQLGVVRLFIGVESLTELGARSLGRTASPEVARRAVELSRSEGLATVFNDIIVHPNATGASIAAELDALSQMPSGVYFEVNPLLVYPMTDLYATLRNEGRLHGGIFGSEYEPADLVARRFHAALLRLALALMTAGDPALYVHQVSLSVAIARQLGFRRYSAGIEREMNALLDDCSRTRLKALRAALALADTELPLADRERCVQSIVVDSIRRLSQIAESARELQRRLDPNLVPGREHQSLLASRATRSLIMVSLGATLACGAQVGDNSGALAGGGGTGGVGGAAASQGGGSSSGGTSARITGTTVTELGNCETTQESWHAIGAVSANCPPSIACDLLQAFDLIPPTCQPSTAYHLYIDTNGVVADVIASDRSTINPTLKQCIIDALANERFPCLSGHEVWGTTPVIIV